MCRLLTLDISITLNHLLTFCLNPYELPYLNSRNVRRQNIAIRYDVIRCTITSRIYYRLTRPCGMPVEVLNAGRSRRPRSSAMASSSPVYHSSAGTSSFSVEARTCAERSPLLDKHLFFSLISVSYV